MTRATRWALAVASVVAVAATATTVWLQRTPAPDVDSPSTSGPPGAPPSIATSDGPFLAGPVAAPAAGAYLGAWVRPAALTQPGRVAAVDAWESTLGRRLDIVNSYRRFDEAFFTDSDQTFTGRGSTLMLSWASADTRAMTLGRHDQAIRERARQARAFGAPILLRFRWEMDRPNLAAQMWSPEDYIAAWRYTRQIFREEGATNVSWVWCPTAEGFEGGYAQPFYPGDSDVDWICVDVYAGANLRPLGELLRPFLKWGAAHPTKPLMIGEFGVARAWGPQARAAWLRDAVGVFKANRQIRAVVYFESDPENGNGPNQQFRLSDDPAALAAFQELARDPHFSP